MFGWIALVFSIIVVAVFLVLGIWWRVHHQKRQEHYGQLAQKRNEVCNDDVIQLNNHINDSNLTKSFQSDLLLRVEDFAEESTLQKLRSEALGRLSSGLRSYIPIHKKGRTLSYEVMHKLAPACLSFYQSGKVQSWVSGIVGEKVVPAGDHDQSAMSILFYDQPGDHIQWHYDHNYYQGRQFTVLLSLVNQSGNGQGASASMFQRSYPGGKHLSVPTEENVLVIFEGGKVKHRVTPTAEGDLRVVLSMTYNTEPKIRWYRELARRVKDVAFHGPKALWD